MSDVSSARVFLSGHIDVPQDRLDDVREALPKHIALTLAENGCLSFNVIECDKTAGRFLVSETFANQAAFEYHQERAKASVWAEITAGNPRSYSITTENE